MNFGPNEMMMDLFRSEVETHSEALSAALLRLERDPSETSCYDSMMRAAHSIKGAARIVRVDNAVEIAHALEDCFVAAQRGELQITPSDFDLLLRSVDLLTRISELTKSDADEMQTGDAQMSASITTCVQQLHDLRSGKRTDAPLSVATNQPMVEPSKIATATLPSHSSEIVSSVPAISKVVSQVTLAKPSQPSRCKIPTHFSRSEAESTRVWLLDQLKSNAAEIEFDFSETKEIDPIALAFLDSARGFVAKHAGASLAYRSLSPEIELVFGATGIQTE